ncbi:MAG: hypothetical protein HY064_02450 [Bacteroidetes bacterium]|nr:hypothetical protein [Bacteroidota bacterium]
MKKIFFFLLFVFQNTFSFAITRAALIDSAVSEGTKKIMLSRFLLNERNSIEPSSLDGKVQGSFNIVIDFQKWVPAFEDNSFYYSHNAAQTTWLPLNPSGNHLEDSINIFNIHHRDDTNYVAFYTIVLIDFPFQLFKDVSSYNSNENTSSFNTLKDIGAIKDEDWKNSIDAFHTIIATIAANYTVVYPGKKAVVYGNAHLRGQYDTKSAHVAAFLAQDVETAGLENAEWNADLKHLPKLLTTGEILHYDQYDAQITTVALAVRNYIDCNAYGHCYFDAASFGNPQARFLFDNLKNETSISKPKLITVCTQMNALSAYTAWCVLTIKSEAQAVAACNDPVYDLYPTVTNADLDQYSFLIGKATRAEHYLTSTSLLNRDSALYYGWILYRNTDFVKTIPVDQKIQLIKSITLSSCADIAGGGDNLNYENHCERIVVALYHNLNSGDERSFLEQLRSAGLLANITWRLDNSTFGFFGNDNYTDFIVTISNYWKKAFPEKISAGKNSGVNFNTFKWEESYFNNNSWFVADLANNRIVATDIFRSGFLNGNATVVPMDVYDPVLIDPVGHSDILALNTGQKLLVPAIFLDWLSQKKMLSDVNTAVQVSLAALALTTGAGELIQAGSVACTIVAGLQVTIAASDLLLLNDNVKSSIINLFSDPNQGQAFVAAYQNITMFINGAVGLKSLVVSFTSDAQLYTSQFAEKELQLETALGENSAEFKGMKKLETELGEAGESTAVATGQYGEEFISSLNGFSDNVSNLAAQQGLTLQEFETLESKVAADLTQSERVKINAIRNQIPALNSNTLLQKCVPESDISKYLSGQYTSVKGYVTTAADAKHLSSYEDIYYGVRLDYTDSKYSLADGECGVIRFRASNAGDAYIPKSPANGGSDLDSPPFTGHGFTSGNNGRLGVPEWKMDAPFEIYDGAELWRINSAGQESLLAIYDVSVGKFVPLH